MTEATPSSARSDSLTGFVPLPAFFSKREGSNDNKNVHQRRNSTAPLLPLMTQKERSRSNKLPRRTFLHVVPLAMLSAVAPTQPTQADGSRIGEVHSELSDLVSKFPGAGKPDIYFPPYYLGEWLVQRDLYAVDRLQAFASVEAPGHSMLSHEGLNHVCEYIGMRHNFNVRFISFRDHVIEDRVYNIGEEVGLQAKGKKVEARWNADNANVLHVSWGNGNNRSMREVKVTKRVFVDTPQGVGTFVTSEYARVVDVQEEGALIGFGKPPSFYGRRRIAKYVVSSVDQALVPNGMNRVVVEYIYPPASAAMETAVVVLKYRDFLTRKSRFQDLSNERLE